MNTYPAYQSPIRFLDELGVDLQKFDPEKLKHERKRLLLEIQLSEEQTIQVGNRTITKNDVIHVFDELQNSANLDHHLRIYEHASLLIFLEQKTLDHIPKNEKRLHFETYDEKCMFDAFVSPYLTHAYDKVLSEVIRNSSYEQFEKSLVYSNLLLEADALFAFRKFDAYCKFLSERLSNTAYIKERFPFEEFTFLRSTAFYRVTNRIDSFYDGISDFLAIILINFTVDQNWSSARSNHLYKISLAMHELNCSNELKSNIYSNTGQFKTETLFQITPNFGIGKSYAAIIAVLLIFLISAFAFGDFSSSKQSARNTRTSDGTEFFNEYERLKVALDQQIRIRPYSYAKRAQFDTTAFRTFQDSACAQIVIGNLRENTHYVDRLPQVISPLIVPDSSFLIPFGGKSTLWNRTDTEFLMFIIDQNALSSYYIPAQHRMNVEIDPKSTAFFYPGNEWNYARRLHYMHPYKSSMSDSILITTNGSFNHTNWKGMAFMQQTFYLGMKSSMILIIEEHENNYSISQSSRGPSIYIDR